MTKVRLNGNLYDARIEETHLILESLTDTLIFEGLGQKIEDECDHDYWKEGFKYESQSSFYSYYMDNHLQFYVDVYKSDAQKVHDMSKNVN